MENFFETLANLGNFHLFLESLKDSGLFLTLNEEGPFTVFAPQDEAFSFLPNNYIDILFKNKNLLTNILKYHLVKGRFTLEDLLNLFSLETLNGRSLAIDEEDDSITVNEISIIKPDIETNNGIIHIIDEVLIPR